MGNLPQNGSFAVWSFPFTECHCSTLGRFSKVLQFFHHEFHDNSFLNISYVIFFFWKRLQCTTDKDLVWNIVRHLSTLIETPNPGTRKRWDGGLIFPLMYHVFLFFVSAFFLSRLRRWCWIMKKRQQREYSELYLFYPLEQKWKKIPREQQNTPNTALVIIHSPLTPIHLSQKLCLINI